MKSFKNLANSLFQLYEQDTADNIAAELVYWLNYGESMYTTLADTLPQLWEQFPDAMKNHLVQLAHQQKTAILKACDGSYSNPEELKNLISISENNSGNNAADSAICMANISLDDCNTIHAPSAASSTPCKTQHSVHDSGFPSATSFQANFDDHIHAAPASPEPQTSKMLVEASPLSPRATPLYPQSVVASADPLVTDSIQLKKSLDPFVSKDQLTASTETLSDPTQVAISTAQLCQSALKQIPRNNQKLLQKHQLIVREFQKRMLLLPIHIVNSSS